MGKNSIRIFGSLLLAAFYCWGVLVFHPGFPANPETPYFSKVNSTDRLCLYDSANDYYYADAKTERYTNEPGQGPVVNLKDGNASPAGMIYTDRILFTSRFSQYTKQAVSFFIRYRKADIIFPFHYFW
jgi:hypothetical protein